MRSIAARSTASSRDWPARGSRPTAGTSSPSTPTRNCPTITCPGSTARRGRPPTTHAPGNCSAFIATGSYTRDGRIVMGHNAWTNYVVGTRWNIIFDIKPEAGLAILMDGLPGVIVSDDDFGVNVRRDDGHRDDDHAVRGVGPGRQARVRAGPQGAPVQPVDRRLRPDHARRQQRRLCQRLADRRQQDGRDRPLRAGSQESLGPAQQGRLLLRGQLPGLDEAPARRDQVRPTKRRLVAQRPQGPMGALIAEHKGKIDLELGKAFETDDFDVISPGSEAPTSGRCAAAWRSRPVGYPSGTGGRSIPGAPSSPRSSTRRWPIRWPSGARWATTGPISSPAIPRTPPRIQVDGRAPEGHEVLARGRCSRHRVGSHYAIESSGLGRPIAPDARSARFRGLGRQAVVVGTQSCGATRRTCGWPCAGRARRRIARREPPGPGESAVEPGEGARGGHQRDDGVGDPFLDVLAIEDGLAMLDQQALDRPAEPRDPAASGSAMGRSIGVATGTTGGFARRPRWSRREAPERRQERAGRFRPSRVDLKPSPMSRMPDQRDERLEDLVGPLADGVDPRVAHHPLERLVAEVALAAVDLERLVDALPEQPRSRRP